MCTVFFRKGNDDLWEGGQKMVLAIWEGTSDGGLSTVRIQKTPSTGDKAQSQVYSLRDLGNRSYSEGLRVHRDGNVQG